MGIPSKYIIVSSIVCIVVCIGDIVSIFVFGTFFHDYSHLKDTISLLGSSVSPVSCEISLWWAIIGVLFIFFGIGFNKAFSDKGANAKFASWLIMLYGFGEGIGSGAFKADHLVNGLSRSAIIHDILGGIGMTAILLLPAIMQKVITKIEMPGFYHMSKVIFISGLIIFLLFLIRYLSSEDNFFSIYKGLWQRLYLLNTYIYLITIAIIIIKRQKLRMGFTKG
jgi:hypothetical protein